MAPKQIARHAVPQVRHGNEPRNRDSYGQSKGLSEPAFCVVCHSVYKHKRWYLETKMLRYQMMVQSARETICPACRKARDRFPGGVIVLTGPFLAENKNPIMHLVRNEEKRAKQVNPLEGIIAIKDFGHTLEIETTNEKFAQRIGKEIKRAFKGEIAYHWTHGDKFVRVEWHRET